MTILGWEKLCRRLRIVGPFAFALVGAFRSVTCLAGLGGQHNESAPKSSPRPTNDAAIASLLLLAMVNQQNQPFGTAMTQPQSDLLFVWPRW